MSVSVTRSLIMMLRVLAWSALPLWALSVPVTLDGTGRELLWTLAAAGSGTACGLVLLVLSRVERSRELRAAEYERLERQLVGAVADLHPHGVAMTRPDLSVVPELRVIRGLRGVAPARR